MSVDSTGKKFYIHPHEGMRMSTSFNRIATKRWHKSTKLAQTKEHKAGCSQEIACTHYLAADKRKKAEPWKGTALAVYEPVKLPTLFCAQMSYTET